MTSPQPDPLMAPLKHYIQDSLLGGKTVEDSENLLLTGVLDSLAVMSLVAFIEQTYDIAVPFEDVIIENFMAIDAMGHYIRTRQQSGG